MHKMICLVGLLFFAAAANVSGAPVNDSSGPSKALPSGKQIYREYCADCHGSEAKGDGPYAPMLKVAPPNLTTLARRHDGQFPYQYVTDILRFGPGPTILHGSAEMPTWGPIFQVLDRGSERVVKQRIKNLADYLASLQVK